MKKVTPWSILCICVCAAIAGCGQPQLGNADEEDYRLVMQLNAALAAEKAELLQATKQRLSARHSAGKIPSGAFRHLQAIVEQAERGEWGAAHRACLDFMKGQRGRSHT